MTAVPETPAPTNRKWARPLALAAGALVVIGVAGAGGYAIASQTVEPETITKTLPAPPAEVVEVTPQSCLDALDGSVSVIEYFNATAVSYSEAVNELGLVGEFIDRSYAKSAVEIGDAAHAKGSDLLDALGDDIVSCRSAG